VIKKERIGTYIKGSAIGGKFYQAYLPPPLPPAPPLNMEILYPFLDQANIALGRLDGLRLLLPDSGLFLYMYIRKEALLSSQIEGTQSSLADLLLFENEQAPGVPLDDVTEVSCYVAAMKYGLERIKELPLSLRLIREIHEKLMNNARGCHKSPGEFRTTQNWIGGSRPGNARFVPPPPERLMETLDAFEKFLHDDTVKLPALIIAALAHGQFETIHPFLDGNGRLGRLLITLILCQKGLMKEPLLYLSLYLKTNRQPYYDHLQAVRETGNWEDWIKFFLVGVSEVASQATEAAQSILQLFKQDHEKIKQSEASGGGIFTVHHYLQQNPVVGTGLIMRNCALSRPTVLRTMATLQKLEIVREITGKSSHKVFIYQKYLDTLSQGTKPLSA